MGQRPLAPQAGEITFIASREKISSNVEISWRVLHPETNYGTMYPKEKGKKMNGIIICAAIIISVGCYFVWSWADAYLFTYLGDVETCAGIEHCYMYDALSWPARIVCFLCGCAAITVFILTWFSVYGILFM